MNITFEHLDRFVTEAHRIGNERLMLCSSGNLSWRVGGEVLLSGTGSWLPVMKHKNISVCSINDGTLLEGPNPSMESSFHLGVLRNREDVNVVLHFQSEYATAIACMENKPNNFNVTAEIPCHIGSKVPIIPYYRPGSAELAAAVTEALTDCNCALLSKHGQVVCGKDFDDIFQKAVFFEMACRIIVQSGMKYTPLTEVEIRDLDVYVLGKSAAK